MKVKRESERWKSKGEKYQIEKHMCNIGRDPHLTTARFSFPSSLPRLSLLLLLCFRWCRRLHLDDDQPVELQRNDQSVLHRAEDVHAGDQLVVGDQDHSEDKERSVLQNCLQCYGMWDGIYCDCSMAHHILSLALCFMDPKFDKVSKLCNVIQTYKNSR